MRIPLAIVIGISVILGMIVETNALVKVHSEYTRRRWAYSQKKTFNIFNEIPPGVHYAYYKRRRHQLAYGRPASIVKIHNGLSSKKSTTTIRHFFRPSFYTMKLTKD